MAEAPSILPRDQRPPGGYECEFIQSLPDSLNCTICLLPFRDPHLLDCCGVKICATCVSRIDAAGQPCPHCREERFMHILDKSTTRQVLGQKVRCSRKNDGCEWEGELRHLEAHERETCEWALVQCRYQCGGRVLRRQLAVHEVDECPHRPVDVKLESFMRKMEECYQREMAAVRKQMEQQKVEYEAKMEQLEQSLQRLRADAEQQVVKLRKEVEEEVVPKCAVVKEMRAHLFGHAILPPCEFTMTGYSQHKRDNDRWYSPPFYTRPGGYKMCLRVNANGINTGYGADTHVSVYMHLMRGEYDGRLKWPFRGDITIQLLNQKSDQEHVEYNIYFKTACGARVSKGDFAISGEGIAQFISRAAVEATTGTTQYLRNDCLKWRVMNIVVHSV